MTFYLLIATPLQNLEVLLDKTKAVTRFRSPTLYFITHLSLTHWGKLKITGDKLWYSIIKRNTVGPRARIA